jgi:acetyl/propionyl-CoA carboxylase alpha subunit
VVKGIKTSIPFHQKLVNHPKFIEGHLRHRLHRAAQWAGGKGGPKPTSDEDAAEARRVAFLMAGDRRLQARTNSAPPRGRERDELRRRRPVEDVRTPRDRCEGGLR